MYYEGSFWPEKEAFHRELSSVVIHLRPFGKCEFTLSSKGKCEITLSSTSFFLNM